MKTASGFNINYMFLAYVPPYRKEESHTIETEIIKTQSKTTDYLFRIFDSAINDAKIEIIFNSDGKQNNDIRDQVLGIAQKNTSAAKTSHARKLAQRLYEETDERNGSGLFVIMEGQKEQTTRITLTRFKGDEGLVNHGKNLLIDYIKEVFTKKSNHYKLVVYEDIVSDKSFWRGFSVDKQISSTQYKPISLFWIESFLNSKTALTPSQGTLQFSKIIKSLLSKVDSVSEQEEIISGIVNIRSKSNVKISVADFCKKYLTEKTAAKVRFEVGNEDFFNSVFAVDKEIYQKEFGKTVLSLSDGITAFVPTFSYNKHVIETTDSNGAKQVIIKGKLRDKRINVQTKEKKAKKV